MLSTVCRDSSSSRRWPRRLPPSPAMNLFPAALLSRALLPTIAARPLQSLFAAPFLQASQSRRAMAELLRKPPTNPPALRPAASFIIAASEEGADPEQYKVLLIQRAQRGPFGGLTVYPGGAVEDVDGDAGWRKLLLDVWEKNGTPRAEAEAILNKKVSSDGISVGLEYYIGAIREVGRRAEASLRRGWTWRQSEPNDWTRWTGLKKCL